MRSRLMTAGAAVLALVGSFALVPAGPAHASHDGFHVSDGRLLDANGNDFVVRGVNHAHAQYPEEVGSLADIGDLGANTARVVLSTGHTAPATSAREVAGIVSRCKENHLICILSVQDTIGFGEHSDAISLIEAAEYWYSVREAVAGEEAHVMINIGSAPWGDNAPNLWVDHTMLAVGLMRSAGFAHTLLVDAPHWGEDREQIMQRHAPQIANADTLDNTVFSVHMYESYGTPASVAKYLEEFALMELPLVVGEFSPRGFSGADVDSVLRYAESYQVGYVGSTWSSAGIGFPSTIDDLVTRFDPAQLTSWGERFFHGPDGIDETSEIASVYAGCTAEYEVVNQWTDPAPGFQAEITVTAGPLPIDNWLATWTFTQGEAVTGYWNAGLTGRGPNIAATSLDWNGQLDPGESASFGFMGTWDADADVLPYEVACSPN